MTDRHLPRPTGCRRLHANRGPHCAGVPVAAGGPQLHDAGLRPHHATGQVPGDPTLFRHRYQHHDPKTNHLVYYQYEARRHDHVVCTVPFGTPIETPPHCVANMYCVYCPQVLLSDFAIESCAAEPSVGGTAVLTLVVAAGNNLHRLRALKTGVIIVGNDMNCTGTGALPANFTRLRERVLADAVVRKAQGLDIGSVAVTLHTVTAGLHECFAHSQMEFFQG